MADVYQITCEETGELYIGSSTCAKRRWREHRCELNGKKHHNNKLQKAWDEHGIDSFNLSIIEVCKEEDRFEREQHYIDTLEPALNISLNSVHSFINRNHTKETKKKISDAKKGRAPWNKGLTKEDHDGLRVSGEKLKGRKVSEETRELLRLANLGKKQSEETIAKRSEKLKGNKHCVGRVPWNKGTKREAIK